MKTQPLLFAGQKWSALPKANLLALGTCSLSVATDCSVTRYPTHFAREHKSNARGIKSYARRLIVKTNLEGTVLSAYIAQYTV